VCRCIRCTHNSFNTHNANNPESRPSKQQRLQIECGILDVGVIMAGHILQVCREYEERLRRMPTVPRFSYGRGILCYETPTRFPCSVTASIVWWYCELLVCWWCLSLCWLVISVSVLGSVSYIILLFVLVSVTYIVLVFREQQHLPKQVGCRTILIIFT